MRYFAPQDVEISNSDEYVSKLRENSVIARKADRKAEILKSIKENCENDGDVAIINNYLLEEVVNLVEYPFAIKVSLILIIWTFQKILLR